VKRPGAAAAVLGLHLLGGWALLQPAPATRGPGLARAPSAAVLPVWLPTVPAPVLRTAAAPKPKPPPARVPALAAAPPRTSLAVAPLPVAVAVAALGSASLEAATATPAPPAPAAPAPAASDSPAPPATALPVAAPAPVRAAAPAPAEPALVQAQADRRDCPPAPHPVALRERGIEGEVLLRVRVGTDGRAAEVRLQQPSGWRLFDQAALAQAQACRFLPARRGAQAEESWVEFPVRFSLKG
jgi:protein TonB